MKSLVVVLCGLVMLRLTRCQDILFPDEVDQQLTQSSSNRQPDRDLKPPEAPPACPDNMMLYYDNGAKNVSVCDCKLSYLYFPADDSCHEAYYRGPCGPHHYVYLAPGDSVPSCARNPCNVDGLVPYNGSCYKLRSLGGPCEVDSLLDVNTTTFQLECVKPDLVPFVIIDAPKRSCPKGSRRNSLGVCKLVL